MRRWIYLLKFAAGTPQRSLSQVRVPRVLLPYFTLSDLRLFQSGGPNFLIYVPQEQGGPVIAPGTGILLVASYDSQDYGGDIRTRLHMGHFFSSSQVKATLRLTVSQSVIRGVESHMGLMTRYLLPFDSYRLVFVGRPL
jgi:hypothetical protein